MYSKDLESSFGYDGSPVKLVQACLSARKDLRSNCDCGGSPVELVVASSKADKVLKSNFDCSGGPGKLVHACLKKKVNTRKDLGSSLHHDGSPVKLVQTFLSACKD